jgi:hypothetical protein
MSVMLGHLMEESGVRIRTVDLRMAYRASLVLICHVVK